MKIYKYPLQIVDSQTIAMPKVRQILSVQVQQGTLCLWALVDETSPVENRCIELYGTGATVPDKPMYHIDTVLLYNDTLVLHVFDTTNPNEV